MLKTGMTHTQPNQLIVALDVPTVEQAQHLFNLLSPVVSTFKIGYWLLFDPEVHALIESIKAAGRNWFLDAKLNDIPETVRHGVMSAAKLGAKFITVHSDEGMLRAAMEGKNQSIDPSIHVMAITSLTSQSSTGSRDQFRAGLANALITKCDGVIMSPVDLNDPFVKFTSAWGSLIIATPGVRMAGEMVNDHGRSGTPAQAGADGADYIIVGRPIIKADDPRAQAEMFISQIAERG